MFLHLIFYSWLHYSFFFCSCSSCTYHLFHFVYSVTATSPTLPYNPLHLSLHPSLLSLLNFTLAITVSFLLHLPILSAILCTGRRDCSQGAGEEGDTQYVLPAGRHLGGPSVLRPGVGAVGPTQCQSHALQSPASPPQEGVPAVCRLLWAVAQNQRHAGTSKARTMLALGFTWCMECQGTGGVHNVLFFVERLWILDFSKLYQNLRTGEDCCTTIWSVTEHLWNDFNPTLCLPWGLLALIHWN